MIDLVAMLGNLSASLPSIERLLGGLSYLLGTAFMVISLQKFKEMLDELGRAKYVVPFAYFLAACALFYLPSVIDTFSRTLFGTGYNVLAYTPAARTNVYQAMILLIQTAGFIWFIRGCVLLAHASQPEQGQEGSKGMGPKGLMFIFAGLFGINVNSTMAMLNNGVASLMSYF